MKQEIDNHLFQCGVCNKKLEMNKAYISIIKSIEQIEHDLLKNRLEVEVLDEEEVIRLCGKCGNFFDVETLRTVLKSIPPNDNIISRN